MRRRLKILLLLVLLSSTVACDRVAKHLAMTALAGTPDRILAGGIVRLEYAENTGGFLSIGSALSATDRFAIFVAGTSILLIALVIVAIRYHRSQWHLASISLLLGGGASNLVDRILHGTVIDFVSIGVGGVRTGIFNLADVAIAAGICMLLAPWPKRPPRSTPLA